MPDRPTATVPELHSRLEEAGAEPEAPSNALAERDRDLLRLACLASGLGTFERDLRTGQGHWNRTLFEIRGLEGDSNAPPFEAAAAGVLDSDVAHFDAAMRGSLLPRSGPVRRQQFRLRYRVRAPDGGIRYLDKHWIVHYGSDGRAEVIRGVVMDETPAQLLRHERDQALAELALAAELTGLAMWYQDAGTGLVRINAKAAALFGIDDHDGRVPLSRLQMNIHPDDRKAAELADRAALAGGMPVDAELRVRSRSDGWRRLFTRRGVQADTPDGATTLMGVAIDVLAAEQTPQARPQARPQVRPQAAGRVPTSDERYRLLARVSHELRTPMNAVMGFAQLLNHQDRSAPDVPPSRRLALSRITMAGQHMLALINDVLDLARLEGGEMPMALRPMTVEQAARGALEMLELPRLERHIGLSTRNLGAWVLADGVRLRQVFLNLIGNAVKYGRDGGAIAIDADVKSDGVHVRVADDGPGLEAEQVRHLFEPFNRLGAEKSELEGTGLGLSISKMLIDRMGGSIAVHSQPGRGTTFELVLLAAS